MIEIGFIAGCFTIFLDFCMEKGNIFEWYGNAMERLYDKGGIWEYISKPIGYCLYCYGTWICLFTAFFYAKLDPLSSLLSTGICHLTIKTWMLLEEAVRKEKGDAK